MLRRIAKGSWLAGAVGLLLGCLVGMAIAARDHEPYRSLRTALGGDRFGGDGAIPKGAAATPRSGRAADLEAAALRAAHQTAASPASAPAIRVDAQRAGAALRRRIREYVWARPTLDLGRKPDVMRRDVATYLQRPLAGVRRVDRMVVRQPHGIDSVVEIQHPTRSPRGFVIVHGGHGDVEDQLRPLMQALIGRGYVVALMNMPLTGWNPRPVVRLPHHGTVVLTTHNQLSLLPGGPGQTLALFLDPVVVAVNAAQAMGFASTTMVGLSGGGWTTTVSAALDPRIRRGFDVAGSLPLHLRTTAADQGDLEQMLPGFYALASFEDLYVLGALEPGRTHVQIFNDDDPCCFALRTAPAYAAAVQRALERAGGGSFRVVLSHNTAHSLDEDAQGFVLRELASR
jgi:hypothetical protein